MGDVLLAQDGLEKEAIEMLQKARAIFETCDDPESLSRLLCKLGEAFTRIEAWDDAITALEKSISTAVSIESELIRKQVQAECNQVLGQTYLEQYYSDESSLADVPSEAREEVIRKGLLFSERSIGIRREDDDPSIYLDLAQEHYFLGDTENARLCSRNTWMRP